MRPLEVAGLEHLLAEAIPEKTRPKEEDVTPSCQRIGNVFKRLKVSVPITNALRSRVQRLASFSLAGCLQQPS